MFMPHNIINTCSIYSMGGLVNIGTPGTGGSAWPASNRAIYIPFRIASPLYIVSLFVANGDAVSGKVDLGIYDEKGTRLASVGNATNQTGTSQQQTITLSSALQIDRGTYYFAIALDNGTGKVVSGTPPQHYLAMAGMAQQATAFPLPATATFATPGTSYFPVMGLISARGAV